MSGLPDRSDHSVVYISPDRILRDAEGACEVFSQIIARPIVTALSLSHHKLGDEGVIELFQRLLLPSSRRYRHHLTEIDLGDNGITDKGVEALCSYLLNNRKLKKLSLRTNNFTWGQSVLEEFVAALNTSSLEALSLSTVPHGDVFVPYILTHLTTPHLKALRAAMTGMTDKSIPALVDFISSSRCRLGTLVLNGNSLSAEDLDAVVSAMRGNFTLTTVDLYGNLDEDHGGQWSEHKKRLFETRNRTLRQLVAQEALALLRLSRGLLFEGGTYRKKNAQGPSSSSFTTLPMELKQLILSFVVPHLSTAQCLRIFNFTSTPSTLPSVSDAAIASCLPDPSAMPLGLPISPRRSCENGTCMGAANSVSCKRENRRESWLFSVLCDVPDPAAMTEDLVRAAQQNESQKS